MSEGNAAEESQVYEGETVATPQCDCYECVGPKYEYTDDGDRVLVNNLKEHTKFEPCEECGRPKTEYLDLGRKGYYICWWCNDREGDDER